MKKSQFQPSLEEVGNYKVALVAWTEYEKRYLALAGVVTPKLQPNEFVNAPFATSKSGQPKYYITKENLKKILDQIAAYITELEYMFIYQTEYRNNWTNAHKLWNTRFTTYISNTGVSQEDVNAKALKYPFPSYYTHTDYAGILYIKTSDYPTVVSIINSYPTS